MSTDEEAIRLATQLDETRRALRPFALLAAFLPAGATDETLVVVTIGADHPSDPFASAVYQPPIPLIVGDIRRAAAALGLQGQEGRIDSTRP